LIQENGQPIHHRNAGFTPEAGFREPAALSRTLIRRVLPLVTSPARYIGGELGADATGYDPARANFLLAFPDAYEVGMSHQGLRILYTLLKRRDDAFADLVFAPWPDMEQEMRKVGLPLFGLETRRSADQFDVIGFSLGYELAYTNMLTMIDLAGSPVLARDRGENDPIFLAGGSCTLNPAVVGPFLDLLLLGDGEDAIEDAAGIVAAGKSAGKKRAEILAELRAMPGAWHEGVAAGDGGPIRVRVIDDLGKYPTPAPLVPIMEPVHDRLALEVMRGCVRGCRFCQAGMITRPVRERNPDDLVEAARKGVTETGLPEVSLLSLSTSDFSGLASTVAGIQDSMEGERTNLVLPSLRVDSVDADLYERISRERPSTFTFAPEAGSQRLRDVINKNITEQDIIETARQAFAGKVKGVKLYFMIGLPTETNEDLDELCALVGQVVALAPRGGSQVHVSISPFAPKAHTSFQWAGQISREEIGRRNKYLGNRLRRLGVKVSLREPEVSFLEALLGLGDSALAPVVLRAWTQGARFDGWTEHFAFTRWEEALQHAGVETERYLAPRDPADPLPWDSVDVGVSRDFLRKDWQRAQSAGTLKDCRLEGPCYKCAVCDDQLQHLFSEVAEGGQVAHAEELSDPAGDNSGPSGTVFDSRNSEPGDPTKEMRKWSIWRQQAAAKCWYRLEFSKTGPMVFLGHLDFQRQLQLALRRSGLPVAYSRGYHPHPLMKFGPPLPVGVVGLRETLDMAFDCQVPGLAHELNRTLPEGLRILNATVVGGQAPRSIDQIVQRFDYRVELPDPREGGPEGETVQAAVEQFLGSESRICVKHRPKGDLQIDARGLVPDGGLALLDESGADGGCVMKFTLLRSANGASLSVHDFLTALFGDALPEPRHCAITRTGYFGRHTDGRWITPREEVGETSHRFWLHRHLTG
jgi:radical SAM-linked protein